MRRVQAAALDLFERHGFDDVRIEEIATAAEVGPATVYRHFGSKERIVLWDDYDPELFASIAELLPSERPLAAVRKALIGGLERVIAQDAERVLRRARLTEATPALKAASLMDQAAMRAGLAELFVKARATGDVLEAKVFAGAIVAALEAAIAQWAGEEGKSKLGHVIQLAFRRLERVGRPRG